MMRGQRLLHGGCEGRRHLCRGNGSGRAGEMRRGTYRLSAPPVDSEQTRSLRTHASYIRAFRELALGESTLSLEDAVAGLHASATPLLLVSDGPLRACDRSQLMACLCRAWATARLLEHTHALAEGSEIIRLANSWGAVQTYYVLYGVAQALMVAEGGTRSQSHEPTKRRAVLRRFHTSGARAARRAASAYSSFGRCASACSACGPAGARNRSGTVLQTLRARAGNGGRFSDAEAAPQFGDHGRASGHRFRSRRPLEASSAGYARLGPVPGRRLCRHPVCGCCVNSPPPSGVLVRVIDVKSPGVPGVVHTPPTLGADSPRLRGNYQLAVRPLSGRRGF